jgi:hypothetical protein
MVKKSLKELPEPDIKNKKITLSRKDDNKGDNKKKVRHLDEILDKSFLKDYFEQKKDIHSIDER